MNFGTDLTQYSDFLDLLLIIYYLFNHSAELEVTLRQEKHITF